MTARGHDETARQPSPDRHPVPLAAVLAAAFGTACADRFDDIGWQWRADDELRWMLPAHLAGATRGGVAWVLVLTTPAVGSVPWPGPALAVVLLIAGIAGGPRVLTMLG